MSGCPCLRLSMDTKPISQQCPTYMTMSMCLWSSHTHASSQRSEIHLSQSGKKTFAASARLFCIQSYTSNHASASSQRNTSVIRRQLGRGFYRPTHVHDSASYAGLRACITSPAKESFFDDPIRAISASLHWLFMGAQHVSLSISCMPQAVTPQAGLQLIWCTLSVPLIAGRVAELVAVGGGEVVKHGGTTRACQNG